MPALRRMNRPARMGAKPSTMFPHTVTVYNVETELDKTTFQDVTINHITILRGVLLEARKAVNVRESGLEGADAATLYIPFSVQGVDGVTGKQKWYVPPAEYWDMADKSEVWTLSISSRNPNVNGNTFFIKGEVVEPDLDAQDIEIKYDDVYDLTKIDPKDFGSLGMQHWEIGAN